MELDNFIKKHKTKFISILKEIEKKGILKLLNQINVVKKKKEQGNDFW